MMNDKLEDKILVMFPSSKNFPPEDPLEELLNEFSDIREDHILPLLSKEELEYDLKELNHKLRLIEHERKRIQYYISEIEQNLDR